MVSFSGHFFRYYLISKPTKLPNSITTEGIFAYSFEFFLGRPLLYKDIGLKSAEFSKKFYIKTRFFKKT